MHNIKPEDVFLFLDWETTGFNKPHRGCQLAMLLTDSTGKSLAEHSLLIKPDGWTVSQFNIDSCGITQDMCERFGICAKSAFNLFSRLASMSTMIVAHNKEFDERFCNIEAEATGNIMPETPWYCTMKTNTDITGGKWPKLEEALLHFCNRELGNMAHNAMYDVQACRDIFFASNKQGE